MKLLKEYESFEKFKLIGIGSACANNVEIYSVQDLEGVENNESAYEKMKLIKLLNFDDEDARAFALVKLDFGELGQYEKFMLGAPTFSHWKLYNKGIEEFNKDYVAKTKDFSKTLTARDVSKIEASLDGRIWKESKCLVLKSYVDVEKRMKEIYENLLQVGIDIKEYDLLLPKLIPEIEDIEVGLRGIYSCKVSNLL